MASPSSGDPNRKRPAPARTGAGRARVRRVDAAPRRRTGGGLLRRLLLILAILAVGATAVAGIGVWIYAGRLDRQVVERVRQGRPLDSPSTVLGARLVLEVGEYASHSRVREALSRAGWAEVDKVDAERQFNIARKTMTLRPPGERRILVRLKDDRVVGIERADGSKLEEIGLPAEEIAPLVGEDRTRRTPVPLAEIPRVVRDAVLAIEDSRFFEHPGVDVRALARALWVDLRAREFVQGGSTLTQQLAKNLFLNPEKKLLRKANEVLIARSLERHYTKEQILELYLNQVYLGQRGGFAIYGVEQGARAYFGKTLRNVDLAEAATLAGSIQAPNRYAPWKHPEASRARRNQVLTRMVEVGLLESAGADAARKAPLELKRGEAVLARRAPWFLERVRELLDDRFPGPALAREGYRVRTTLDLSMQLAAEAAVKEGLAELEKAYPKLAGKGRLEAALVALDPSTGDVKAWVGGREYGESQFDRIVQARRQPGSAFKPIVLAAAFEALPERVSGSATWSDDPYTLEIPGSETWTPANYDKENRGLVTLREATWDSRNLPFVRLGQDIGFPRVVEAAEAMGVSSRLKPLPSMVLGAQEVTPLDLAIAYATLANGGLRVAPRWFDDVTDGEGRLLVRAEPSRPARALSPQTSALVTDLLRGVVERGTGARAGSFGIKVPFVGKTGTTDNARDAWFAGYAADLVTVVWVGFDSDADLGLTGAAAALPVWGRFMGSVSKYLSGVEPSVPDGMGRVPVCARSGRVAHPGCPVQVQALFSPGTEPAESCGVHGLTGEDLGPVTPYPPDAAPALPEGAEADGPEIPDGSPASLPRTPESAGAAVPETQPRPDGGLSALKPIEQIIEDVRARQAARQQGQGSAGGADPKGETADAKR